MSEETIRVEKGRQRKGDREKRKEKKNYEESKK
jgi:hypothetical protein